MLDPSTPPVPDKCIRQTEFTESGLVIKKSLRSFDPVPQNSYISDDRASTSWGQVLGGMVSSMGLELKRD
jgi:hypothetical protein